MVQAISHSKKCNYACNGIKGIMQKDNFAKTRWVPEEFVGRSPACARAAPQSTIFSLFLTMKMAEFLDDVKIKNLGNGKCDTSP